MIDEILKIDQQLCFRLYAVSRKMTKAYKPLLQKFNLTYPQYIVMLVLFEHRKIDFHELSKIVQLKTGTLTPIIDKLHKIGYIEKERNESDGRKVFIVLSKTGEKLNDEIIEVPLALASQLDLKLETYQNLVNDLDRLSDILNINLKQEKEIY